MYRSIPSSSRLSRGLTIAPVLGVLGLGLCASLPASAQLVDIPAILDSDLKAPPTVATLQYGHQFKADVEDDGTEIARDTAFFGLAHRFEAGERTTIFGIANYTLHAYDFSGDSGPSNRYRWDDVHRIVLGAMVGHELNDHWSILGGALVRSWGEGGADFGDTISGGLIAGFDYHENENFSVGLLVGALSKLDGGVGLIPVPTLKWAFAESWRFNMGMIQLVDPGVGAQLTYQVTPEVSIGTGFAFQSRQYRLADRTRVTPTADRPNRTDDGGIGQETELPVFAMIRWRPVPQAQLDLHGGVALGGNVRVEDKDGGRIRDDDYDPAGLLGLRAQYFF